MQALILAAGLGTGIRSIALNTPKVMMTIWGRPLLEYTLLHLRKQGVSNVILAVGYLAQDIRNYFRDGSKFDITIHYSENHLPLGTGGEIKLAAPFLEERFFVINGDTYFPENYKNILARHLQKEAEFSLVACRVKKFMTGGAISLNKDGLVIKFGSEKVSKNGMINAGLYVMERKFLRLIPAGERVSLENDVFPRAIENKLLYGLCSKEQFIEVGTPESYSEAINFFKKYGYKNFS